MIPSILVERRQQLFGNAQSPLAGLRALSEREELLIVQALADERRAALDGVFALLNSEEVGWNRGDMNYLDGLPADLANYKKGGAVAVARIRMFLEALK